MTNSVSSIIKKIEDTVKLLTPFSEEVRLTLLSRNEDRILSNIEKFDFQGDKNNLQQYNLFNTLSFDDFILTNKNSLLELGHYIAFESPCLQKEKKVMFNMMLTSYSSPNFWYEFANQYPEEKQKILAPLMKGMLYILLFSESYIKHHYQDEHADFAKLLIEHERENGFFLYKNILWLEHYQPESRLTNIIDKNIFNYIKHSQHSKNSDSLVFHMVNLFSGLFERKRNDESDNITLQHSIALKALNEIATSIDNNIEYFSKNLPLSVVVRNVLIPSIYLYFETLEENNISDYIKIDSTISHNINVANIYNQSYFLNVIKRKNLPLDVSAQMSIAYEKELISDAFRNGPVLLKTVKNRI